MYVSNDRYDLAMFLIFLDFQDKKDTEQTGKSHDEDYDTHVFDIKLIRVFRIVREGLWAKRLTWKKFNTLEQSQ